MDMSHSWNDTDRGNIEVLGEKPVPVSLCPLHLTRSGLGLNSIIRGGRPVTYRLSYGTAFEN
jgi:hypothetical protein